MIPAKRLAEIRERGGQNLYPAELLELVAAYEAARRFAHWSRAWLDACNADDDAVSTDELHAAKNRLLALFPEPTK